MSERQFHVYWSQCFVVKRRLGRSCDRFVDLCMSALYWFHTKLCISILKVGKSIFFFFILFLFISKHRISIKMAKDKIAKKGTRKVSAYNSFIKTEIAKVKRDNPDMAHKDAFKKAASNWSSSPENPKCAKK
ncbi:unnamed protein product [Mucor fragilis]